MIPDSRNHVIGDLVDHWAKHTPEAKAISAPGRASLTYSRLRYQVDEVAKFLNALGLSRGDPIAVVLPNGPEMAVCFLGVTRCATCAPLNPAYRTNEFEFYLSDIGAKALIVLAGSSSAAEAVANARGIPVLRLSPKSSAEAGVFTLEADSATNPSSADLAKPEDVALILHTSGTTGRPKLVPLTQANLHVSAGNIKTSLKLSCVDRCLNVMPLFHVHGLVGALLSSMAAGAQILCTPGFHSIEFFQWMEEFQPTWFTAVPTMHQGILARARHQERRINKGSLRFIRSCSAPLPPQLMAQLEDLFNVPVVEAYGMTEASHQISINPLPPGKRKPGSVGVAEGQQVGIMDDEGNLLAAGSAGAIVIRGPNVMRGYGNQTPAEGEDKGGGWFRTGDRGYLDSEGYLFIIGRIGEIINRGGEKISPREIDEVLLEHPAIEEAVTFAVPDARLGQEVGAAVVLRADARATEIELQEFVALRLADFKVPRRAVFVKELPKGATGKLQRVGMAEKLGLADAGIPPSPKVIPYVGPRTQTEQLLSAIWCEVLRLERVGINDDFFDLGGDSLLATQIFSQIGQAMELEFPVVILFQKPTIALLAKWLDSADAVSIGRRALVIDPVQRNGEIPLSFGEQRMWFLAQYDDDTSVYVTPNVFRLEGALDVQALKNSLCKIVDRHEVLRTTYQSRKGAPCRVISHEHAMPLPTEDVSNLPEGERLSKGLQLAEERSRRPIDLSRDLMLRAGLVKLGVDDHLLFLAMHHIASDAWSRKVFYQELAEHYGAEISKMPPHPRDLPIQYADYACWQRQRMQDEKLEEEATYWKRQLAGSKVLQLPTDRPRPKLQTYNGKREALVIPEPLSQLARELSKRRGATLFMTLLAVLHTLLHRHTNQDDISVGIPVANRTRVETEGLIGFFVNTLVLRVDLSDDPSFAALLDRVRNVALEAYAHQEMPFEKVVEVLQPERNLSFSPLFQVMFAFDGAPPESLSLPGLTVRDLDIDSGTAKFDLTFSLTDTGKQIEGYIEYNTDLFDAASIGRMAGHYVRLLGGATEDEKQRLSQLPLLKAREREHLAVNSNATYCEFPREFVHELFQAQAKQNPDTVAVVFEDQKMSYGELDRRANQLANYLRKLGAKPNVLVGVFVERSVDMIVALLGVLKAGGAYVPIDPLYPPERMEYVLADSGVSVLLTQKKLASKLSTARVPVVALDADWNEIARESVTVPGGIVSAQDRAYVTYTSGSTGRPKGVEIQHGALRNLICSMREKPGLSSQDTFLAVTTLSFDIAALELFLPLCVGAKIVIASRKDISDGRQLLARLTTSGATVMQATPVTFQMLVEAGWNGDSKLRIFCGGEPLSRALANQLLTRCASLWNMYGPTETTIWSSTLQVQAGPGAVPIGPPIHNTQFHVLDRKGHLLPIGVPGELHIGGLGLASGYLNRPELTAKNFIPDPFRSDPSGRLYKTGDIVRRLPDGKFEFLGRMDSQIKLRGFRIELGEIESVLSENPGVRECVVVARDDSNDEMCLVAYIVPEDVPAPSTSDLLAFLKRKLPGPMVPSKFVLLETLPLTLNGKVDRAKLPVPEQARAETSPAPRDEFESRLAIIWEKLLGVRPIGVRDNFFEIGGHSLSAVLLLYRIEESFHQDLPVAALFEGPTIEDLANLLRKKGQSEEPSALGALQTGGSQTPLFCVHGLSGELFDYLELARCFGPHRPVYGLQARRKNGQPVSQSLKDMAANYIQEIRGRQPEGPYLLAGHSSGGTIALEVAQQLQAAGQKVALVAALDALYPNYLRKWPSRAWTYRIGFHLRRLVRLGPRELLDYLWQRGQTVKRRAQRKIWELRFKFYQAEGRPLPGSLAKVDEIHRQAIREYNPKPFDGRVVLFRSCARSVVDSDLAYDLGWSGGVTGRLDIIEVPGDHVTMLVSPQVQELAEKLEVCLQDACAVHSPPDRRPTA